jgi:cysteinyl-tRNA synthetase
MLLEQKGLSRDKIDELVSKRIQARKDKNYEESDRLRDELTQMGIDIRDSAEGTLWEVRKGQ